MLLSEFRNWAVEYGETNFSKKTAEWYRISLDSLIKLIGDKEVTSVTPLEIEKYKTLRKKDVAEATVNINLRAIKSCFRKAFELELLQKNPTEKIKGIREADQCPLYLTNKEASEFLGAAQREQWFGKIVLFAIQTGLRRGEITNLLKKDVDIANRVMQVHSTTGYRVKFGKRRVVTLNDVALQIVKERMTANDSEPLFTDEDGKAIDPTVLTKKFRKYVRELGLNRKLHFHSLRHTFGSLLCQNNVPLRDIQELMGHSRITVTEKYAHTSPEHLHMSTGVMSTLTASSTGMFSWN
ncbi:MAG TPA: tyrosine-type recombinase/integrase [Candidatus Kryptonia bacterium]